MKEQEVCWNITARCNLACEFCHRFLNVKDLDFEENKKILEKLIHDGVKAITWTGGEALLYPDLAELLKIAKENGIKNKLITNGKKLIEPDVMAIVQEYIDNLTLSLDSINDKTNILLRKRKRAFF